MCFDDLLAKVNRATDAQDPTEESRILRRALDLWRGPALSNVDSDTLHRDVVFAWTERRWQATQRRIDLDLLLGNGDDVIPELKVLTSEHPTRERFFAQLMLVLYRGGRQADALETYRHVRELLDAELGVAPGRDLQELHQLVLTADPALMPVRTPIDTLDDGHLTLGPQRRTPALFEHPDTHEHAPTDSVDPEVAESTSARLTRPEVFEPVRPESPRDRARTPSSRQRALVPLGVGWLLATSLTLFASVFDKHIAYLVGLLLMGAILVTTGAVVASDQRHRRFPRASLRPRKHWALRAALVLPLLAGGYVLAEVVLDDLDVPVMGAVPLFASASFVNTVAIGSAPRGRTASPDSPTRGAALGSLGAITSGLLVGGLVLLAERGLESSWTTGQGVDGAFAEGILRRISRGEVQVSGELLDDVANYQGTRLHVQVLHADGSVEHRETCNGLGKGGAEAIRGGDPTGRDGIVVAGNTRSIQVKACSADADPLRQRVVDTKCGAWVEIWPR